MTNRPRWEPLRVALAAALALLPAPTWASSGRSPSGRLAAVDSPPAEASRSPAVAGPSPVTASVTVIRPPAGDALLEEASLRIRSELDAVGASNRLADCSPGLEGPACGGDASAVRIALAREEGIVAIQVTANLPDGLELRRHVRVPAEAGGEDPSVIAVRAVELVRDIYLDIPRVARRSPPVRPTPAPSAKREPAAAARVPSLGGRAFLGPALLQGRWGLHTAVAPSFGFGVSFVSRFALLAMIAGPFHATVGSASEGRVDTLQTLGILQLRYELDFPHLRPYATAGAGLFSLAVQGRGEMMTPADLISGSHVAPLVAVGVGLLARLMPWLAISIDVQEIVTWPVLDVTPQGTPIGRAGGPSDLLEAGLVLMSP